jgi:cytochrome c-type biogenesis protein CcmH/NrfG
MRQGGWLGLIGLLIALVIVAVLAQTVLKSYGLIGSGEHAAARGSSAPQPAASDATRPAPANPIERARGLEQQVQRDAQDLNRRIDEQAK